MMEKILKKLDELLELLGRAVPPKVPVFDPNQANAFLWQATQGFLQPVAKVNHPDLSLLQSIDEVRDTLFENTTRFAKGFAANNALLWGARGMGKSSLIKAVHAKVNEEKSGKTPLKLVEIHREDIESLPALINLLRPHPHCFLLFCDDLSFNEDDTSYKALKTALDGGVEGGAANCLFYATSNRRHLMARQTIENEQSTAIMPGEAVEEKVSLSDRFGLWLGFYSCTQDEYLAMVQAYLAHYDFLKIHASGPGWEKTRAKALEWAITRGSRSGRVAFQFITDLAGREGKKL